jgi:hypothetical protein
MDKKNVIILETNIRIVKQTKRKRKKVSWRSSKKTACSLEKSWCWRETNKNKSEAIRKTIAWKSQFITVEIWRG